MATKGKKRSVSKSKPAAPLDVKPETEEVSELPQDLQAAVDAVDASPQERCKMVRLAFASRGWPNADHPGTVRDFCVEHDIPCL